MTNNPHLDLIHLLMSDYQEGPARDRSTHLLTVLLDSPLPLRQKARYTFGPAAREGYLPGITIVQALDMLEAWDREDPDILNHTHAEDCDCRHCA